MGKHVDRQLGGKEVVKTAKPANFKIESNKAFKELVEKVAVLEASIADLTEKLLAIKTVEAKQEKTEE